MRFHLHTTYPRLSSIYATQNFLHTTMLTMGSSIITTDVSSADQVITNGASNGQDASRTHEEYQYLKSIEEILEHGEFRPDR